MTAESVLEASELHLSFGSIRALDGVGLDVRERELLSIIGPNGAGKSSLLNCLSGFYRPQHGRIRFLGEDVTRHPPHRRAGAGIARTFQGIQTYPSMTVQENILSGFHPRMRTGLVDGFLYWPRCRREESEFTERAEEIIEFLELEDIRHSVVGELGYGMRKRVDLGRAIALLPRILIMDEPMAGMSVDEKGDLARYALDIRDALKIPVVLVDHDMEVVMDISDRIVVMDWGQVVAEGSPEQIRNDERVITAYLGEA